MEQYSSSTNLVSYNGQTIETTVTNQAHVAEQWLHNVLQNHKTTGGRNKIIVGFDCKYKLHPIRCMSNNIALIQLCIGTRCLILQIMHMDHVPLSLKSFFSDKTENNVTFFGKNMNEKADKLWREYGIKCSEKIEIHDLLKICFPLSIRPAESTSLKSVAKIVAKISPRTPKKAVSADWESRVLDEELVEVACVDAYTCYTIVHKILERPSIK